MDPAQKAAAELMITQARALEVILTVLDNIWPHSVHIRERRKELSDARKNFITELDKLG